ncbi:MAG: hypothetical protein MJ168_05435 [Clostridia bacterium]|nr:hypothetical protein [Clostridia bacterium]
MANRVKRVKYPEWLEKTDCTLVLEQRGVSEDGAPITSEPIKTKCIYSEHAERMIDKDGVTVMLTGKIYKQGDIAPELSEIAGGTATVNGGTYQIIAASRPRNPDGTVHHTELKLK